MGSAGSTRNILVWAPSRSSQRAERGLAVLIAISPGTFLERIPTPDILQYLIRTGEVRPTLLVVVPEPDRSDERTRYAGITAFLADTVLPAIRARYAVSPGPEDVVVTGTSRRGLMAAVAAVNRPDAIGAVLSLSGSFYWAPPGEGRYEWLSARVAREPRKPLRWFVASGSLETVVTPGNHGHYMVGTNRHLNDVLTAKGYTHFYEEFAGVHHEANWEDALATGLRLLLPGKQPSATSALHTGAWARRRQGKIDAASGGPSPAQEPAGAGPQTQSKQPWVAQVPQLRPS
ncbi:MAG: alpha/beta hydrolase [Gemmatimonadales bacterium]